MSESVVNGSFDMEAQQSLLQEIASDEGELVADQFDIDNGRSTRSKQWVRLVLLVRSVQVFKLASASYDGIRTAAAAASEDDITLTQLQDSAIEAAVGISVESVDDSIFECQQQLNIELQCLSQREHIVDIVQKRKFQDLVNFGGVKGVAIALNTDLDNGISNFTETSQCSDLKNPNQVLIVNTVFICFLGACKNPTILLLSVAAALSLAFGINEKGEDIGWFNGATVICTVFVLITCTTAHDAFKEIKSMKNSGNLTENRMKVRVVRGGDPNVCVPAYKLRVGDIAVLQKGEEVPADGIFVSGDQSLELDEGLDKSIIIDLENPFLFYGSRVINGNCRMIVTAVGMNTVWGEMMRNAMKSSDDKCEFESYLHKFNTCVQVSGLLISILIIIVLFLRYKGGQLDDENGFRPELKDEPTRVKNLLVSIKGIVTGSKGTARVLITLLSVSLVGIMEGMPVVISLAITIRNGRTLVAHKALERDYLAFIKMASVTMICTDKFGGLTESENQVSKLYIGEEFVSESSVIHSDVLEVLCDSIGTLGLNPPPDCESKLESLVSWAEAKLGVKRESLNEHCKLVRSGGCNPFQEYCQILKEKNGMRGYLHCNGPPETIFSFCSHYYDAKGNKKLIDDEQMKMIEKAIECMRAEDEAEVVAFACKEVNISDVASETEQNQLIFLGMISIINTNREDTKRAISTLMEGGIRTILVSGDDIAVLKKIGEKCGLPMDDSDNLVIEAENFRAWTEEAKMEKVEKISIIGNCLPSDKILLIKSLREKGNTVALLAQRTLDAPALKQADVGLTFGSWSSEVARESAQINIWHGDFRLLVNMIESGRSFQANTRKFIQLQLIATISSMCINFASIVILGDASMTAIQLFWLNLVISVFGGLALLLGPPTELLMKIGPTKASLNLIITKAMCRNIAIQASYQTTIFVTLQQKGQVFFGISGARLKSFVYNGFFICQIFNKFIARQPADLNIFRGLFDQNWLFFGATMVILICQVMFGFAEVVIGSSPGLNWKLLLSCLFIGLFSLVVDWFGKKMASSFIGD